MNEPKISAEKIDAAEKAFKRKFGSKLPLFFIVFFAALCAGIEMISPATSYEGHFIRLLFFGLFTRFICRILEEIAEGWQKTAEGDAGKSA